jgi:hypothetical protein
VKRYDEEDEAEDEEEELTSTNAATMLKLIDDDESYEGKKRYSNDLMFKSSKQTRDGVEDIVNWINDWKLDMNKSC